MEKKVIYFIYPDVHEVAAHTITEDLKNTIHIITNPDYDRLKSYLTNNPKAICVLLISDNFLRSMPCMAQAVSFMQAGDYNSMISIVLDSQRLKAGTMNEYENYPTNIDSNEDSIRHRDFWWDELIRLRKASNKAQGAEQLNLERKKKLAQKISTRMSLFIDKVKNYNPLSWDAFRADNYQVLFDKLGLGHTSAEERFGFRLPSYEDPIVEETKTEEVPTTEEETPVPEHAETTEVPVEVEPEVQLVEPVSTEDEPPREEVVSEEATENELEELVEPTEENSTEEIETEIHTEETQEVDNSTKETSLETETETNEEKTEEELQEEATPPDFTEDELMKMEEAAPSEEILAKLNNKITNVEETVAESTEENNSEKAELVKDNLAEVETENTEDTQEENAKEEIENTEKEEIKPESNPIEEETIMEENENKEKEFIIKSLESLEDIDEQALVEQLGLLETEDLDVLFHVAETKTEEDDFEDARFLYEKILQIDPFNGRALIWLARLLNKHFDDEKSSAEALYRKAIAFNEPNAQLNYEYGLLARDHFQSAHKAAELFKAALEIDPKFEQAYYELAVCQLQLGMAEAAKANYLQAYLLDEDFRSAEEDVRFGVIRLEDLDESAVEPDEYIELEVDDNPNKDTVVLVTGATSGIGRSLAERLAIDGYKVIITGRRENRLAIFKKYLEDRHDDVQIEILTFDVRDEAACKAAFDSLPEAWKNVDILINNAGLAKGFAPFQEGDMNAWEQMIDTNVKGLLYMSRMISPIMVERKKGHIVNVSSVASTQVYPNGNVYCATKAAVDSLTKTMRIDLHSHNIRVSSVSPGHVETEFALIRFDDKDKAKIYDDYQPLKAEDVSDAIYYMISRPSHVNIQDMLLFGTQQASVYHINRNGRVQEEENVLIETEQ